MEYSEEILEIINKRFSESTKVFELLNELLNVNKIHPATAIFSLFQYAIILGKELNLPEELLYRIFEVCSKSEFDEECR